MMLLILAFMLLFAALAVGWNAERALPAFVLWLLGLASLIAFIDPLDPQTQMALGGLFFL